MKFEIKSNPDTGRNELYVAVTALYNWETQEVIESPAMSRNTLRRRMAEIAPGSRPRNWKFMTLWRPASWYRRERG